VSEEQEQEKTYEVKDRRRVSADGTIKEPVEEPSAEPAEAAAPEGQECGEHCTHEHEGHEHAGHEHPHEDMPPPSVYDLLQFVAGMIAEQAWLHMGLRLAPGKKEPTKDLVQAKVAVDTVVYIAEMLHPHISENDHRALRGLVSDLQVNFVKQSQ
jgi:hypothetical protein